MAGILVRDADGKRLHFCGEAEGGEEFGDIAGFGGKFAGVGVLFFAQGEEMMVFLEGGAAAGGVGDDGVEVFAKKCGEIVSREIAGSVANAGVRGERAAAELILWDDDFAAIGGKDADGGFVELRKSDVGNASGEKCNAGAARAGGGKRGAEMAVEKIIVDTREETFALDEAEKLQDADTARDGLQAGTLIETQNTRGVDDAMRFGEKVPENEIARGASEPGTGIIALDARTGVLDEFSIFDAGGAGGFAGAAVEAFVDVVDEGIGDRLLVQLDLDHLVNAAARRIGFEVPQAISGAGVEAEAAVDAAGVVLVDRNLARDSGRWHGSFDGVGRFYGT
jgi:hypothetical protein